MIIEIWSDFACPFCYIGKKRFEEALNEFEHKDKVKVIYKSFILDPNAQKVTNKTATEELALSKGISVRDATRAYLNVVKLAETVGLTYNIDKIQATNTFDAHRLVKWAESKIDTSPLIESLYKAYFIDGLNLADKEVLSDIADKFGLNKDDALNMLNSEGFLDNVEEDIEEARTLGVTSIPTFISNRTKGITGALRTELFLKFLNDSYEESKDPLNKGW